MQWSLIWLCALPVYNCLHLQIKGLVKNKQRILEKSTGQVPLNITTKLDDDKNTDTKNVMKRHIPKDQEIEKTWKKIRKDSNVQDTNEKKWPLFQTDHTVSDYRMSESDDDDISSIENIENDKTTDLDKSVELEEAFSADLEALYNKEVEDEMEMEKNGNKETRDQMRAIVLGFTTSQGGKRACKICYNYLTSNKTHMMEHFESKHLKISGLYQCENCLTRLNSSGQTRSHQYKCLNNSNSVKREQYSFSENFVERDSL